MQTANANRLFSGIGKQTAISFAVEGCTRITITDTNTAGLKSTKQAIQAVAPDASVLIIKTDVRAEHDVVEAVKITVEKFGRIDYAVNCAGARHTTCCPCSDTRLTQNRHLWPRRCLT